MSATDLATAELTLTGRIRTASNATFSGEHRRCGRRLQADGRRNPAMGLSHGSLAHREMAAYLVSETLGWGVVPRTWLRDGPLGEGMVQLWREQDPGRTAVDLVASDQVPEVGWKHVLEGRAQNGRMVTLIHEDSPPLRRMTLFDIVANNADRKGDHIWPCRMVTGTAWTMG